MKVGLIVQTQHPWDLNEMALTAADSLGVDSLWTVDHLLGLFHPVLWKRTPQVEVVPDPDAYYDPFVLSAVLGQRTLLPLGVAVTDATRRRAADVARTALSLQHLCTGGFNLGIGAGEAQNLLPFGYEFSRPVARCEEFLIELRALLDGGRMPDGGVGALGLPLASAAGRPRIWLAGHGPRMLRLTGQYADGWLPIFHMSAEEYGRRREVVFRHAAEAGRSAPECGLVAITNVGESRERLAEQYEAEPLARLSALGVPAETWREFGLEHPCGPQCRGFVDMIPHLVDPETLAAVASRIPFELVERSIVLGGLGELTERFEALARQGLDHVMLMNISGAVGGRTEAEARAGDFAELVKRLARL